MQSGSPRHVLARRASGLVRTIVVALSTFAILLVCFSMYQYGQGGPAAAPRPREPRLPDPPTSFTDSSSGNVPGLKVGEATIGRAESIHFTIYREQGRRAAAEISFSRYLPKEGSDNEFLLEQPVARLQTKAGNDLRVTAPEGVLEAARRGAGDFDPKRGRLTGGVVIEFDRRTEAEKAALPAELRDRVDPSTLVRIETEELEFDVEYNMLIVPGPFRLEASDALFEGGGLEMRLDESQGRLQLLRVTQGGRIVLTGPTDRYGFAIPSASPPEKMTIVQWLRATVQSQLAKVAAVESPESKDPAPATKRKPAFEIADDGVPVFRIGGEETFEGDTSAEPTHYFARFEGNVQAVQEVAGAAVARFSGDWLEIHRQLAEEGGGPKPEKEPASATTIAADGQAIAESSDRLVLGWTGPLRVEITPQEIAAEKPPGTLLIAGGTPAKLANPQIEVLCTTLQYPIDAGSVEFFGDNRSPAEIRSADQGRVIGRSVSAQQTGDGRFTFKVAGPGSVDGDFQDASLAGTEPFGPGAPGLRAELPQAASGRTTVAFDREMVGSGRMVKRLRADLTGHVSQQEERLLDRVSFDGQVKTTASGSTLESNALDLVFGVQRGWSKDKQYLTHLDARGDVTWTRDADRLSCDRLQIPLGLTTDGRPAPNRAIAEGKVEARQDSVEFRAAQGLEVEFDRVTKIAARPADSSEKTAGIRQQHAATTEEAVPRRLVAKGGVEMKDPGRALELSAQAIDCTLDDARQVQHAVVTGAADAWATIKMNDVQVWGERIEAGAADERADVPGPGRMVLQSKKDLDGKAADKPIPIEVTWAESMKYRGRDNVALFAGDVQAKGRGEVNMQGRYLRVEFRDAPTEPPGPSWGLLQPLVGQFLREDRSGMTKFSKEPASIYLEGDAVATTERLDPASGSLKSRARLAGPKMALNLRPEGSKALIEGAGTLQLEDFNVADAGSTSAGSRRADPAGDLFGPVAGSGPSKTLVEWTGRMWHDFAVDQVRFEDGVQLKFLSGAALDRVFQRPGAALAADSEGRATFIQSRVLTIDLEAQRKEARGSAGQFADFGADRIARFHANGSVVLQDESGGVVNWIKANDLIYDRPNYVVVVSGNDRDRAQIVRQEPDKLPTQWYGQHAIYNTRTGNLETTATSVIGR